MRLRGSDKDTLRSEASPPWAGVRLLRHLVRSASVGLLTQVGFALLAFVNGVLLARYLGAAGYGAFNNAIAWVSVAIMPATLGLGVLLVRQVAVYRSQHKLTELASLLRFADRQALMMSMLVVLVVGFLSLLLYRGDDAALMRQTLWVALPLVPMLAVARLREGGLRGWEAIARAQIPGMLLRPALLLLGLLLFAWWLDGQITSLMAMAINLAATLCALLLLTRWSRALLPSAAVAPDRHSRRTWLGAALPMMIAGNMQVLLTQTDIMVLGVFTSAQETGVYSAAARLAYLLFYGTAIADLVLAPVIARFHAKGQLSGLQPVLTRVVRWSWLLMLPVGLVLILAREPLLGIFGPEFVVGGSLVVVLVIGRLLEVALGSGALVLTMTGHEALMAKVYTSAMLINLLLNFALIPFYGALGAATATVLSAIGAKLAFALLSRQETGVAVTILGSRRQVPV